MKTTKKARRERGKQDWATPARLYEPLDAHFMFVMDCAAHARNKKHDNYLGPDHPEPARRDALSTDWEGLIGASKQASPAVFVNPPYSRIAPWVEKAIEESGKGVTVVMVLPDSTAARWYHRALEMATEALILKGRVSFVDPDDPERGHCNDRGTTIFVFSPAGGPVRPFSYDWKAVYDWLISECREAS